MRTTVTLDADTELLLRRLMAERGISFKQALNDSIRAGAAPRTRQTFRTTVRSMGVPTVNLDRALRLAGELEDEDMLRRMRSAQ
jgi:hypothetical protein